MIIQVKLEYFRYLLLQSIIDSKQTIYHHARFTTVAMDKQIDISVISILNVESDALKAAFEVEDGTIWRSLNSARDATYASVEISAATGARLTLALVTAGHQGNAHMAVLVESVVHDLRPKLVVLVGIAAGIIGENRIGDLIVPRSILDFSLSRKLSGNDKTKSEGEDSQVYNEQIRPTAPIVKSNAKVQLSPEDKFQVARMFGNIMSRHSWKMPEAGTLIGFEHDDDKEGWLKENVSIKDFKLHDRCLASSDILIRNPVVLTSLAKRNEGEGVKGADMESAGLYWGCQSTGTPWLVIRGVSDFGDDKKSDAFQPVASARAAAYCAFFVSNCFRRQEFSALSSWNDHRLDRLRALSATMLDVFRGYGGIFREVLGDAPNISLYWHGTAKAESKLVPVAWRSIPNIPHDVVFTVRGNDHTAVNRSGFLKIKGGRSLVAKAARDKKGLTHFSSDPDELANSQLKWVCTVPIYDRAHGAILVGVLCITAKWNNDSNEEIKHAQSERTPVILARNLKNVIEPIMTRYKAHKWTSDLREEIVP